MTETITLIKELSVELSENSLKINQSTILRKESAQSILDEVNRALISSTRIHDDIKQVCAANTTWRNKDNRVYSTCKILQANINQQNVYVQKIEAANALTGEQLTSVKKCILGIEEALKNALSNLLFIIDKENDILLLDKLLESKKRYQVDALKTLQKLSQAVFNDSERAEKGALINYKRWNEFNDRSLEMLKALEDSDSLVLKEFNQLAKKGCELSNDVARNSRSQYEFNDQVNHFVDKFYRESITINELIEKKHLLFEQNLQNITVLTVIISFEFKKYLILEKVLNTMSVTREISLVYSDLMLLNEIASQDIKDLTDLNMDMTEISHITNENETKIVEFSKEEIKIFNSIKNLVIEMMQHTELPIDLSEKNVNLSNNLLKVVNQEIKEKNIELPRSETTMSESAKKMKTVMVIDDGAAIRQVVSHVLKSEGYEILEGVDGADALAKLDGNVKIDLFICDVNMPNMDGIEFLEKIKTDEKYRAYKFAPIIMLTTEAGESMKEKGKQLGAHAWMVKPFQPDQLLAKIKPILG